MTSRDPSASSPVSSAERVSRAETARRQAEIERDRLFNLSLDLLSVANFDGWFEQVNPAWTDCLGWTAEELTSRPSIEFVHPDFREETLQRREAITQGQPLRHFDNRYLHKDGSSRWLSWNVYPLLETRKVFAVARDITERKRLEQQVLRAQRVEGIGTLAGGIAHDLNNVLAPILMSIDLLRLDLDQADRLDILNTVETSVRRGAEMVRHVLSFARGIDGERVAVMARHLFPDVLKVVGDTFPSDVVVKTSLAADLWSFDGDPMQVQQVLLALCENARDAMSAGGTLTLAAENTVLDERGSAPNAGAQAGPYVVLTVADTGTGMSAETLARIFDPFFTTRAMGKGAGMGLSTALAIVRGHAGFIDVESEPGKGSRFRVHLPATPAGTDDIGAHTLPRGRGELVLVVDDDAPVRELAGRTLEAFGYRVVPASDGAQATAIYAERQDEIALVLTDMRMPVMDGAATIGALRALDPDVRIIAASGFGLGPGGSELLQTGAAQFLAKPYSAEALLKAVRDVLDGQANPA